ncbi:MAG: flagellar hook-length control protein FliK [Phycisphaerae bacterium]|nr:flagellar hook-length control protein FliK [Phycisphaerae bacterium]
MATNAVQSNSILNVFNNPNKNKTHANDSAFDQVLDAARQETSTKKEIPDSTVDKKSKVDNTDNAKNQHAENKNNEKPVNESESTSQTDNTEAPEKLESTGQTNESENDKQDNTDQQQTEINEDNTSDQKPVINENVQSDQAQQMLNMLANSKPESNVVREDVDRQNAATQQNNLTVIDTQAKQTQQPTAQQNIQPVVNTQQNVPATQNNTAENAATENPAQSQVTEDQVTLENQPKGFTQQQSAESETTDQQVAQDSSQVKEFTNDENKEQKKLIVQNAEKSQQDIAPTETRAQKSSQRLADQQINADINYSQNTQTVAQAAASVTIESQGRFQSQRSSETVDITETTATPGKQVDIQQLLNIDKTAKAPEVNMQDNIDQIVKAVNTTIGKDTSVLTMRMDPPELGNLRVEIKMVGQNVELQLQATNEKTHQLLQQSAPQLKASLEAAGMQNPQINIQLRMDLQNSDSSPQQQSQQQDQQQNPDQQSFQEQQQQQQENDAKQNNENEFQQLNFSA